MSQLRRILPHPALSASLVVIWLTSSLWFFDNIGFPSF